jgi:hypothetical protein
MCRTGAPIDTRGLSVPFDGLGLLALGASALIAASACFLLSNGSFHWLGDRGPAPTLDGWMASVTAQFSPTGSSLALGDRARGRRG